MRGKPELTKLIPFLVLVAVVLFLVLKFPAAGWIGG